MERPKKSLGQSFLVNPRVAEKILSVAGYGRLDPHHASKQDETVVEIGPGHGILTKPLAERACRVIAIDIDKTLVSSLEQRLGKHMNLQLIHGDALTYPYHSIPGTIVVVSNLPYYLATPLLFRLLALRAKVDRLVLMFQLELAERMAATPGTKAYGQLSVAVQYFTDAKIEFRVPRTCFIPEPAVDSAVVSFTVLATPRITVSDEQRFLETVRRAFAYRRKTLVGSLRESGLDRTQVLSSLAAIGIDHRRRAETLTLEEFAAIAEALAKQWDPNNAPNSQTGS